MEVEKYFPDKQICTKYMHVLIMRNRRVPMRREVAYTQHVGTRRLYIVSTCLHAQIHTHTYSHSHSHSHLSCRLLELPGISHQQVVPALLDPVGPKAA